MGAGQSAEGLGVRRPDDDTTWSARSWTSYTAQRISCVLARAVVWELATAMQLTRVRDAPGDARDERLSKSLAAAPGG